MRFARRCSPMLLCLLVALPLLLSMSGCTKPAPKEKVELTFFIFAGANQGVVAREVADEYMKKNPNVVIEFVESSNILMYPQMVSHKKLFPQKPLVNIGYFNSEKQAMGEADDMWLTLDPARIPNLKDILPVALCKNGKGVATRLSPVGLMYNSQTCPTPPTSWLDLINPAYRGKIVLWDYIHYQNLMPIAYALTGDYKNVDKAFEAWAKNIDMIHSLQTGNEGLKQALVTGGGWINPRSSSLEKPWEKDSPIRYAIPKEGQFVQPIYLEIVKGSSEAQIKVAEELINILLSPQWSARDAELMYVTPVNSKAPMPESIKGDPAYAPEAVAKYWTMDWVWVGQVNQELSARWDREVKARMR